MKKNIIPERISFKMDSVPDQLLDMLFTDVLGARNVLNEPGLKVHVLENGTALEIYGTGSFPPENIFNKCHIVLSFRVENIEDAARLLVNAGARLLSGITTVGSTYAYCHLFLNNDIMIGLYQEG